MPVISIDLAYRDYRDIGIALLIRNADFIDCTFHPFEHPGEPDILDLSAYICNLAERAAARTVLIDGPQGWKHPENGLDHSRICERLLNTPAKTGLPGQVKPLNYLPFVQFSIDLFLQFTVRGWRVLDDTYVQGQRIVLESFPLSAWRSLRIQPLPSKRKHTDEDIASRTRDLQEQFRVRIPRAPSHDELQAIVAGLGGIAFEAGNERSFNAVGHPPLLLEGTWREGFIVNPQPIDCW